MREIAADSHKRTVMDRGNGGQPAQENERSIERRTRIVILMCCLYMLYIV
jgi:hypothetical protein